MMEPCSLGIEWNGRTFGVCTVSEHHMSDYMLFSYDYIYAHSLTNRKSLTYRPVISGKKREI